MLGSRAHTVRFGQGGNVDEWLETAADLTNDSPAESRIRIGGSWVDDAGFLSSYGYSSSGPSSQRQYTGFRVGSVVPEPSAMALGLAGLLVKIRYRRKGHIGRKMGSEKNGVE